MFRHGMRGAASVDQTYDTAILPELLPSAFENLSISCDAVRVFPGSDGSDFPTRGQADSNNSGAYESLLLSVLECLRVGGVLLDGTGNPLGLNATARQILSSEVTVGACLDEREWARRSLSLLVSRARGRADAGLQSCMIVPRQHDREIILRSIPVAASRKLMVMIDPDGAPYPRPEVLQRMFGLTAAEVRLALQIVRGATPGDISRANRVSITTVRSQLASVFAKTQTGRQTELAALLGRLALLS